VNVYASMTREELLGALEMFAKNWLAHDGCWFLAAEEKLGLDTAIELDAAAWRRFAAAEARRIMDVFGVPRGGGLEALERALALRMYALVNEQHAEWSEDRRRLRFVMDRCRVQDTRRRKGLADFPCRPVGTVEFTTFASTIDPRIVTTCLHCPPDAPPAAACAWEFTLVGARTDADRSASPGGVTPPRHA
jgi:hypothetical protein